MKRPRPIKRAKSSLTPADWAKIERLIEERISRRTALTTAAVAAALARPLRRGGCG